jgi:hypothetical protein
MTAAAWAAVAARWTAARAQRLLALLVLATGGLGGPIAAAHAAATAAAVELSGQRFEAEVERRLDVPVQAQAGVIALLEQALVGAGLQDLPAQHLLVVDRSPQVQAAFVMLRTPQGTWRWVGASPVSTGRVGSFDHFRTPLGVFAHSLDNLDYRAEGTFNSNGIRGYGVRGMRVFDFGWVQAERGWGRGGRSPMRLQMHATDPTLLEPRLGRVDSKGCIRIAASLNQFLDRHGILDADYEEALAQGQALWMLRADRTPLPWPGRWLVVVDSQALERPHWAPLPVQQKSKTTMAAPVGDRAVC